MFKFSNDRLIPSRAQTRSEFLLKKKEEDFDISLSENNLRTMKKIQYQNQLRAMFNEQQEAICKRTPDKPKKKKSNTLLHLDWACKLTNTRDKFLPDFETLEKKNFSSIRKFKRI